MANFRQNRRDFMALTGAGIAGATGGSWLTAAAAAEGQDADLVVYNAKVYTVDAAMPTAQAFAVRGGRFIAVGTTEDIKGLATAKTKSVDAKGMTILPGFIDCHNHAPGNTLLYDVIVGNPYVVEYVTIQSVIDKLKERAAKTPPGTWVPGYFFDDTKVKDNRMINIHDLDKVSTEHPVVVHDRGGHTAFYNSKAFQMAGVTKSTPNPYGGTFDKDDKGELNGRATDTAMLVLNKIGKQVTFTPAQQQQRDREGLAYISKKFVQYGLTSVCHESGNLFALQDVRARGDLKHRVSYEANGDILEEMIKAGIQSGFGDEWIKFGATSEHTVDGSFSERTMAISKPYIGITPPYHGNLKITQEDLDAWVERVHRAGIRPNVHSNGDLAIERTLNSYERALKLLPAVDSRPKITHCSLVNDQIVTRMKAINAVPAEFNTYAYYNADKFHFYGQDMMQHMMPYRTFQERGIVAAGGSDFSPGPFDPLMAIQGMVTRKGFNGETWGPAQKVSVDEAIKVNTLNGAYNTQEEKIKGSITAGKLADYVMLAEDPHTVDPEKIINIKLVSTTVGGDTVYQA